MNRREIIMIVIGGIFFLTVLFGFYLPRTTALNSLNAAISREREEIDRLERFIPDRTIEDGVLPELIAEAESLRDLMEREYDISLATGELVQLCRVVGGITIDSITEVGEVRTEEGLDKWLIKLYLQASFYDFARLLHRLNESGRPLAVDAFIITNEENRSPLSRIELTVAACVFGEGTRSEGLVE